MAKFPEQIGKYKILSHLGSGGTSIVYLGLHPTLKRKVVLKKLNLRGKKSFYDRFLQEAALMMDLNHDHIVKVYDHFKEGSRHYMVMEFVEGASLDRIIEETGPLSPDTVRYVLRCCARALSYIHGRNIIHRDIKPSNIFISSEGKVKLGDFGIAMLEAPDEEGPGGERPILGTPSYMAPEQFSSKGRLSPRTDIYALGVSCYELLTGNKLFSGESLSELRGAVVRGRHAPLLPLWGRYGFSIWRTVRRSIFRLPMLRYSGAAAFSRSLKTLRLNEAAAVEDLGRRIGVLPSVEFSGRKGEKRAKPAPPPGLASLLETPVRPFPVKRILFLTLFLLFLVGTAASVKSGLFFSAFMPNRIGAFSVLIESEKSADSFSPEKMELFRVKNDILKSLGNFKIPQIEKQLSYRESGLYRMRMEWGNRVQWRSFYLPPLSQEENGISLLFTAPPIRQNPVKLSVHLSDALSSKALDSEDTVYISSEKGWEILPKDSLLLSGESYSLGFSVPGYEEQTVDLDLDFYEDEVILDIELIPRSGQLSVQHNLEKLSLTVNGKKRLRREDGTYNRFGALNMEGNLWNLSPGVYHLTWSGKGWSQDQELTVRGGETVIYRIIPDENGELRFEINRKR